MRRFMGVISALVLLLVLAVAVAPTSTAVSDKWLARYAMKAAWAEQSSSERRNICLMFLVSPGKVTRMTANAITRNSNVPYWWAQSYAYKFFDRHC